MEAASDESRQLPEAIYQPEPDASAPTPFVAPPIEPAIGEEIPVDCGQPFCQAESPSYNNSRPLGIYGFVDYLHLKTRGANVPFGQGFDGITATAVPRGPVGVASNKYESALRLGFGVDLSPCSQFSVSVTWFESEANDMLTAMSGNAIHSFLTFPNTTNVTGASQQAKTLYEIHFYTSDADIKNVLLCQKNLKLYYRIGASVSALDQELNAEFEILGGTTIVSEIDFFGAGPRAGFETEYALPNGLFTYGKGMLSLLVGEFEAEYTQRNVFTGLQGSTRIDVERIVPVLDLEAGIGWQNCTGNLRVRAGYIVNSWYNTLTTPSLVQGIRSTNFTTNGDNFRDTLTFDGFVGRIEIRY